MGAEWVLGQKPAFAFNANLLGGDLSIQEGQVMIGVVPNLPAVTMGGRIGVEFEHDSAEWYLMTRQDFDDVGGAQMFVDTYLDGGGYVGAVYEYPGYYSEVTNSYVPGIIQARDSIYWGINNAPPHAQLITLD